MHSVALSISLILDAKSVVRGILTSLVFFEPKVAEDTKNEDTSNDYQSNSPAWEAALGRGRRELSRTDRHIECADVLLGEVDSIDIIRKVFGLVVLYSLSQVQTPICLRSHRL